MKREYLLATATFALAAGLVLAANAAQSADRNETELLATQSARMNSLARTRGATTVSSRMSSDFSDFAGSTANADALVSGLRGGRAITLTSTDANGVTTSTTFTPPTARMGYGNAYISLALARQQLAGLGITDPTTQQIQAALVGGTVTGANGQTTALTGVLALRAQGMGWGKIAQSLGYKLGPVISAMKSANASAAAPTAAASSSTIGGSAAARPASGEGNASARGVVTAAGAPAGVGHGNAYGRGIVTATGAPGVVGQGNAYGRGIVTGTGAAAGQGAVHGRSEGKGN